MRTPMRTDHSSYRQLGRLTLLVALAIVVCVLPARMRAATITYVQSNYAVPQTPQTSVAVTFTAAQVAGDLNVVVVGWNDSTATVSAVTDTKNNVYTRAVGPTVQAGVATQSIYCAKNIVAAAAGANTITVTLQARRYFQIFASSSIAVRILPAPWMSPLQAPAAVPPAVPLP
jgi:hypothetical protein